MHECSLIKERSYTWASCIHVVSLFTYAGRNQGIAWEGAIDLEGKMRGKQGGRGMGDGRTKGDQGEEESLVAKLVTQYMQMGVVVLAIFPFI